MDTRTRRTRIHPIIRNSTEKDAFNNIQNVMLYISLVITLTATSTLQDHIKEHGASDRDAVLLLPKALKQTNEKSEETHLIRYMSDDLQIQEPNAIYLQCVVPQVCTRFSMQIIFKVIITTQQKNENVILILY